MTEKQLASMALFETQDTYIYTDQLYDELQSSQMNQGSLILKRGVLKWGIIVVLAILGTNIKRVTGM